jgi:hypothetical protein
MCFLALDRLLIEIGCDQEANGCLARKSQALDLSDSHSRSISMGASRQTGGSSHGLMSELPVSVKSTFSLPFMNPNASAIFEQSQIYSVYLVDYFVSPPIAYGKIPSCSLIYSSLLAY